MAAQQLSTLWRSRRGKVCMMLIGGNAATVNAEQLFVSGRREEPEQIASADDEVA